MKPELHLFIIWQRGRYKEQEILADMMEHFVILHRYAITWSQDLVSSNFTRFYGVRLPSNSVKEQECGTGEFLLCVVRDEHPIYGLRHTTAGDAIVNTNMFDAKSRYRDWTGGGHKIHATNSEDETNHDLTLLVGKNIKDFLQESHPSDALEFLQKDLEGAIVWTSLEHLFYVLNNTVSYVILRGSLEPSSTPPFYCDTDIITPEYENFRMIVNGTPALSEVRPKSELHILDKMYYLDVWDSRRKYYDPIWLDDMLKTSVLDGYMRMLNEENDFYCLLYHCLTNKGYIDDKYTEKLQSYKEKLCITENDWAKILVDWLDAHHYEITEHTDISNNYDLSNPIIRDYALRYGKCIRIISTTTSDILTGKPIAYVSKVFQKENSFVKAGSPWLIDNEMRILDRIGDGVHFPKLLAYSGDDEEHWIEISAMPGKEMFKNRWKIRMSNIRNYPLRIIEVLKVLYDNNILHRDVQPENILISEKGIPSIIDFGWAIDFREDKSYPCPQNMKMPDEARNGYSDFYNLAMIFDNRWFAMPFVARFAEELRKIDGGHYTDKVFVEQQINLAKEALHRRFSWEDYVEFIMGKYKLRKYWGHPHRLFRRFEPTIQKCIAFFKKLFSLRKVIGWTIRKFKRLFA